MTNLMKVIFCMGKEVVIDDQQDLLSINNPSQQVNCNQKKWRTGSKFPYNNIPGVCNEWNSTIESTIDYSLGHLLNHFPFTNRITTTLANGKCQHTSFIFDMVFSNTWDVKTTLHRGYGNCMSYHHVCMWKHTHVFPWIIFMAFEFCS